MTPPGDSSRAGRWAPQSGGYLAFVPAPLPPDPPLDLTGELGGLLSEADHALGRLDGSIETLPYPQLFVSMYVRKEAVLSSQIEGTQSSLEDVLRAEARMLVRAPPDDVAEVLGYLRALDHGLAARPGTGLTVNLLLELHRELLRKGRGAGLDPGHLRRRQNWIGAPGSTPNTASFVPPPADLVPDAMERLVNFAREDAGLPLLVRAGLVHAQFETIHPFRDGNGRVGRLLIVLMLSRGGLLGQPVLYLSHFLKQHQREYYDLLQAVRREGSWEDWLGFFLRGVAEVSRQATATARAILTLREQRRSDILRHFGRAAPGGLRLLDHLYEHPIIAVDDAAALNGTTWAAANALVARFVRQGIIEEITGQARNRRFLYREYVNLFHA